jgi:hypothetical protein
MKTTPHLEELNRRYESEARTSRRSQTLPHTAQHYQSCRLGGNCGTPAKFEEPAFFKISNDYFAEEAKLGFAVDAAVFAALIGTALFPILNGVQAVATLIHTTGVL